MNTANQAQSDAQVAAYYAGRQSIADNGKAMWACDYTVPEMINAFARGQRDMRAELRLGADPSIEERS